MGTRPGKVAVCEQLLADGITHIFGNPGTVEQGLLDELEVHGGFQYILTLQETVAAGIADGYARATQQPTLLQLHSGVGLGNGIGMLYQAMRGHAPIICIAGEAGVCYDSMDAQMASDLVAMARPVTKWAARVTHPSSVLRMLRRAIKIAMTEPRGPVFLALPMDVLDADTAEAVVPTVVPATRTVATPDLIGQAAALLNGARRPLVLLGDGVATAGAQREVTAVAERLGADVWLVDSSEPNMSADHPLVHGNIGHMFGPVSTAAVKDADAVLVVGTYLFPEVFPSLDNPFADDAKIVHVDLNAYEIAKNHPVTLGIVADPKPTMAALADALDAISTPAQRTEAQDRIAAAAARAAQKQPPHGMDSVMAAFLREVAARVPEDVMVFDEALTASPLISHFLPPRLPGHNFITRGGSLGVGFPGTIGLKVAHPERTVIGFSGDGGSMYTIQSMWTAARYDIGAKFVVCNNRKYELLNDNIDEYWREQHIAPHKHPTAFDTGFPETDFVGLARSLSVPGARLEKVVDAEQVVERMFATQGPFLVEVATEDLIRR
ncbi:MAG TPA: thiamine pyrophosphate-binding protein [Pseudonocardiaceae bacterium]